MNRRATAALLLVVGLLVGLLLSGALNTPAPALTADEAGAQRSGSAALAAAENGRKLEELSEFANNLETLFQTVADSVSPAVVLIESQRTITRRPMRRDPLLEDFLRGSPFGGLDQFLGPQGRQPREFTQRGLGSGFLLDQEGHILTNNHVVGQADQLRVQLSDGREFEAEVAGTDPKTDLAVIRISGSTENLPTLPLGDSDNVKAGQWVMAVGNPFGLRHTVSVGIVSATGRRIGAADYESMIQTDAAINSGNSGGPLVNLRGQVIGINTAIVGQANLGIGFAIPANMAKDILDDLIAGREVRRGFLGVRIEALRPDMAEAFGYKGTGGALVQEVTPGTPAEKSDLQAGDIVTSLNGRPVADDNDLRQRIAGTAPGETIELGVWRDGRERTISVTLDELTDEAGAAAVSTDWLGLSVQTLTPEMARQMDRPGLSGVLVADVADDSPVRQRIQPGDVILSVERTRVEDAEHYRRLMSEVRPGQNALIRVYSQRNGYAFFFLVQRPAER
ncbi:MAG: Do family serine endopeptidase [Candidatus Brocadiaceae bacterium]|nr:Do family serine endopeptidase [Candidatus Brocadiaceae bacterium]